MIHDKFEGLVNPKTKKPFSRQYIYQLRQAEDGKCIICGNKAETSNRCKKHAKEASKRSLAYYYSQKRKKAATTRKRRLARQQTALQKAA